MIRTKLDPVSANYQMSGPYCGVEAIAPGITITLPPNDSFNAQLGEGYPVANHSSGSITVAAASGEKIADGGSGLSSITLQSKQALIFFRGTGDGNPWIGCGTSAGLDAGQVQALVNSAVAAQVASGTTVAVKGVASTARYV